MAALCAELEEGTGDRAAAFKELERVFAAAQSELSAPASPSASAAG
jgi:hypothetical protein